MPAKVTLRSLGAQRDGAHLAIRTVELGRHAISLGQGLVPRLAAGGSVCGRAVRFLFIDELVFRVDVGSVRFRFACKSPEQVVVTDALPTAVIVTVDAHVGCLSTVHSIRLCDEL